MQALQALSRSSYQNANDDCSIHSEKLCGQPKYFQKGKIFPPESECGPQVLIAFIFRADS